MASSPNIDDNSLSCGICTEPYKYAKILPCLHSFCGECISRLVKNEELSCPVCRRQHKIPNGETEKLPDDAYVNTLVEHMQKHSNVCGGCNAPKTAKYCIDCAIELCSNCVTPHQNIRATKSHKLLSSGEYQKKKVSDPVSLHPPTYCHTHTDNRVKMYCDTCCSCVCVECSVTSHSQSDHKVRNLDEAAADIKHKTTDLIATLKVKEDDVAESESVVRDTIACLGDRFNKGTKEIKEHVEKTVDEMTRSIRQSGEKVLGELKDEHDKRKTKLQSQLKEIEGVRCDLSHTREFADKLVTCMSSYQMMLMKNGLMSQIDKLVVMETKYKPVESGFMEFKPFDDFCLTKSIGELKTGM